MSSWCLPSQGSILQGPAGAHFQVAAHTDPSLLLLGSAAWRPCLGHKTWGAVAAVGALRVLAVTMGTECSRPVQVIALIHIYEEGKQERSGGSPRALGLLLLALWSLVPALQWNPRYGSQRLKSPPQTEQLQDTKQVVASPYVVCPGQ